VLVSVLDSGAGLACGAWERLFEAFFTTKPGGMGPGLSISRTFLFTLPASDERAP
jgi:C4-dicarboxylate-specific signal transduction histidine kinase